MPPRLGRFDAEANFCAIMGHRTGGEVGRPSPSAGHRPAWVILAASLPVGAHRGSRIDCGEFSNADATHPTSLSLPAITGSGESAQHGLLALDRIAIAQ
jgi:hypothetical protein